MHLAEVHRRGHWKVLEQIGDCAHPSRQSSSSQSSDILEQNCDHVHGPSPGFIVAVVELHIGVGIGLQLVAASK
jgi:hypothetical protein